MARDLSWLNYATHSLLLCFTIIFLYLLSKAHSINFSRILKPIFLIYLFPIWTLITAIWSLNADYTVLKSINYIYVTTGLVAICFLWTYLIKKDFFKLLLPANIFLVIISFLSLLIGMPEDAWEVGHGLSFAGIFTHQNIMAMALLFTLPGIFSFIMDREREEKSNRKFNLLFALLLSLNLFLIAITYSRAAILVSFIGILIALILSKAYKIISVLTAAIILITILTFTIKSVNDNVITLLSKHGWDILATRTVLWEPSYEAAKLGGIWGIGFGNSHPNIQIASKSSYDEDKRVYIREKGNGSLALIEETGIIGWVLFFLPVIYLFKKILEILRIESNQYLKYITKIILTFLIMFLIHSNFEAWFTAIGSTAMPMFLILMYAAIFKLSGSKEQKDSVIIDER